MFRIFLIIIGIGLLSHSSAQESNLSLAQCLKAAEQNSALLAIKPLQAEALLAKTKRLNRALWPQTTLIAQASWQSEVLSLPISFPGVEIPSPQAEQYRLSLDIQQTLWDGGVTKAQKQQAEAMALVNNVEIDVSYHQVKGMIEQLFFGALMAEWQAQYTSLIVDDVSLQLAKLQAAVDNGVATPGDLQRLQAKLIELEQKTLEAAHLKAAALAALQQWTGIAIGTGTIMLPPEEIFAPKTIQLPELRLLEAKALTLDAGERLIHASNLPKLAIYANLGYGQPGLNLLSNQWNTYAVVGARLHVPISYLYSGSQRLDVQQLHLQKEQISLQKKQFLQQTESQRIAQVEEINRLEAIQQSDEELIRLRNAIAETAAVQLNEGIITSSDYITAVNDKELAHQQQILHQVQKMKAIIKYNHLSDEQ